MSDIPIFQMMRTPVMRQPVEGAPVWLWDPEIETYVLVDERVEWTEGHGPEPVVPPPSRFSL